MKHITDDKAEISRYMKKTNNKYYKSLLVGTWKTFTLVSSKAPDLAVTNSTNRFIRGNELIFGGLQCSKYDASEYREDKEEMMQIPKTHVPWRKMEVLTGNQQERG
ncbi:hypothetical protein PV325_004886 [Microctonus aethiopoides]|nr:hypothetical protein PV325_004886 [Microctonus aethiopoides]